MIRKTRDGWKTEDLNETTNKKILDVRKSNYKKKDPLTLNKPKPKVKQINKSISHLSTSAKMEVYSFDLDPKASGCVERCEYGKEKVCYVLNNGNENYPSRKLKLKRNLAFLKSAGFVTKMKIEIMKTRQRQFRWFSAGDLPDLESLKKIVTVCDNLPAVVFWLPTSRDDILTQYFEVEKLAIPKNLIIRLSAPDILQEMPQFMQDICQKWGVTWTQTTLNESLATCHASKDGLSCELCEDCFELKPVTYLIHGQHARKKAQELEAKLQ